MLVTEMEERMSQAEFNEWLAFFKIQKEVQDEERMHAKAKEGIETAKARPRRGV